jgi:hypothetical protein
MFSPAAATFTPAASTSANRALSPTTWSEGKIPITVSGSVFSSRNAASAHAGAVFRAAGSLRMCSAGKPGSCAEIVSHSHLFVITQTSFSFATGNSRASVCWIIVSSPSSANTCLARDRRLRGQNRVPLPPARITGANRGLKAPSSIIATF